MPDAFFEEPRLAAIYDLLEPERPDLDPYLAMASASSARRVLDIGCGTGTFACLLARRGLDVTGVDPAAASLAVARHKPHAHRVHWVLGTAAAAVAAQVDLVTMTGNVAQVFLTEEDWTSTLRAAHAALRPGGTLVFEVRDPEKKAWRRWTRVQTLRRLALAEVDTVETWIDLTDVALPLVTFRQCFVFASDGAAMVSTSTLRFRSRFEVEQSLLDAGFALHDIRDAPDRPGLELVFVARRPPTRT